MVTKSIPKLRFKRFNDKWISIPFKNIAQRISKRSSKQGLPRISFDDINSGMGTVNKIGINNEQGIYFQKGDVLFGKLRPYLKNWLLTNFSGIAVGDFWVLRSKNNNFLYALIQTNRYFYISNITSGTKMPRSDWNLVSNYKFYEPSLSEQQQIGEFFATLDQLIQLQRKKITLLKRLKKAYLQKLFPHKNEITPKIRFKGFHNKWSIRKLDNISKITMGQSPYSRNYNHNINNYILVQGNADINEGRVTPRIHTSQVTKLSRKKDIILTIRAPVGMIAINQYPLIVIGRGVASISKNDYIYYDLMYKSLTHYWRKYSTGSTFESINSKILRNLTIKIPSLQEQNSISLFLKYLDINIRSQKNKFSCLNHLKKAYLQKMFC